jgi:SAM-dependent methyltransferase
MGSVGPVPVLCGSLWETREAAMATPTATLDLAVCGACGHVWNSTFDTTLVGYDAQYDNALDFSPTFRAYAESLAARLVETYELRGSRIVEIGSGKGEFLKSLCALGAGRGIGFDPTYVGPDRDGPVEFVREFFTPDSATGTPDFVCCRHVLEHVEDPYAFLRDVRGAVRGAPVPMYFEVPNAEFNFAESGPWDLIYPHVAYFSETSFRAVLSRAGFRVLEIGPVFNSQFLSAEVVPDPSLRMGERVHGAAEPGLALGFRLAVDRQLKETETWRRRLDALSDRGPVSMWGAGSKGVTFLSLVDHPKRVVRSVVDSNPRKWGRYLPGCGNEVVPPDVVVTQSDSAVLVMNPAYAKEIRENIDVLGGAAEVIVV